MNYKQKVIFIQCSQRVLYVHARRVLSIIRAWFLFYVKHVLQYVNGHAVLVIYLWTVFSLWTVPSYWWFIFELFPHIGDLSLNCSLILVIYLLTVPSYWWFIFEMFSLFELFPHIGDFSLNYFLSLNCSLILVIYLCIVLLFFGVLSFLCIVSSYCFYAPATKSRGHINLPLSVRSSVRPFVRPDIDTWFVRLQFWSYSFNIL